MPGTTPFLLLLAAALPGLASPDFPRRESATALLETLGEASTPFLESGAASGDAEVRWRCRTLLARLGAVRDERRWRMCFQALRDEGFLAWPMLDSLPKSHPGYEDVVREYRQRARDGGADWHSPCWQADRVATRLYVEELFQQGWCVGRVRDLLRSMIAGEADQCRPNPDWAWYGSLPLERFAPGQTP